MRPGLAGRVVRAVAARIVQFWAAPLDGSAAAVFRVAFAILAAQTTVWVGMNVDRWYAEGGVAPSRIGNAAWSLWRFAPDAAWMGSLHVGLLGLGSALIDGRDETAGGQARNTYQEFAQPGGTHLIGDFQSGLDVFVYSGGTDATIEFFNPGALDSPFGAQAGTRVVTPGGTTYLFFDTGADGIQDVKATDVFKI